MSNSPNPGSFEDFLRWLTEERPIEGIDRAPPPEVLTAAGLLWRETQSLRSIQQGEIAVRLRTGSYREDLELMAAAEAENSSHPLPRLRTPNGFVISPLYATNSVAGTAPIALLVECPVDSIEVFKGHCVQVLAGERWVEIGEIDGEGKATGDLPEGVDFKPPFSLRVGAYDLTPADLKRPEESG